MTEQIRGLNELQRKLRQLGPAVGGKTLRSAGLAALLPAFRAAQNTIPVGDHSGRRTYLGRIVGPGFSKRSIRRKVVLSRDKQFIKAMLGVDPEAFTAVSFLELGTSKMAKQPWLVPAFESNKTAILARFKERLRTVIKKYEHR